jgi:magnesium transporter
VRIAPPPPGASCPCLRAGFLGIVGGALCDFAALGFGAQSIVAPLGSISVVANVVIAPMLLGERPTRRDLYATALIVAGCAVAVSFASHKDHLYMPQELLSMYRRVTFYGYIVPIVVGVIAWLIFIRWIERKRATYGESSPQYRRFAKFHRFSYPALSGIAGAQSVLFAKTCVELVTDAFAGSGAEFLTYVPTYAVLLAMAMTITLQVYWLNCGLSRWDALYIVPVFSSFWILFSVIGGGVFYEEFALFSWFQALLFPIGVCLAIAGVYVLSQREAENASRSRAGSGAPVDDSGWRSATDRLLEADASLIARAKATIKVVRLLFESQYLGLSLAKVPVRLVSALNPRQSRVVQAWSVRSLLSDSTSSRAFRAEDGEEVMPGDLLVEVNGESLLDRWISHTDAIKRITHMARPLRLGFRVLTPAQRRRVLGDKTGGLDTVPEAAVPATPPRGAHEASAATPASGGGIRHELTSASTIRERRRRPLTADPMDPSQVEEAARIGITLASITTEEGLVVRSESPESQPRRGSVSGPLTSGLSRIAGMFTRGKRGASEGEGAALLAGDEGQRPRGGELSPLRSAEEEDDDDESRGEEEGIPLDVDDPDEGILVGWGRGPGFEQRPGPLMHAGYGSSSVAEDASVEEPREGVPESVASLDTTASVFHSVARDYVISIYVADAGSTVSPADQIRTAHHALQNMVMDPMAGIFHMGGLIGPSVIFGRPPREGRRAPPSEHPLAAFVDRIFPNDGGQWRTLDRWLEGIGGDGKHPEARASRLSFDGHTRGVAREAGAHAMGASSLPSNGLHRKVATPASAPSELEERLPSVRATSGYSVGESAARRAAKAHVALAVARAGAAGHAPEAASLPSPGIVHDDQLLTSPIGVEMTPLSHSEAPSKRLRFRRSSNSRLLGQTAPTSAEEGAQAASIVKAWEEAAMGVVGDGDELSYEDLQRAMNRVTVCKRAAGFRQRTRSVDFGLDAAIALSALCESIIHHE